jgi:hypothetical protein
MLTQGLTGVRDETDILSESSHEINPKWKPKSRITKITIRIQCDQVEISFQVKSVQSSIPRGVHPVIAAFATYGRPEKAMLAASVKAHAETHAECDEKKAKLAASFKAHAETQWTCDEERRKHMASVQAHAETHAEYHE